MISGHPEGEARMWGSLAGLLSFGLFGLGLLMYVVVAEAAEKIRRDPERHRKASELYDLVDSLPRTTTIHKGIISSRLTATVYDPAADFELDILMPVHLDVPEVAHYKDVTTMEPQTAAEYLEQLAYRRDAAEAGRRTGLKMLLILVPILLVLAAGIAWLVVRIMAPVF